VLFLIEGNLGNVLGVFIVSSEKTEQQFVHSETTKLGKSNNLRYRLNSIQSLF